MRCHWFNAWGISNGTAAGIAIAQEILGQKPEWASIYDPVRKVPKKFNKGGDSQSIVHSIDDPARRRRRDESWSRQDRDMER